MEKILLIILLGLPFRTYADTQVVPKDLAGVEGNSFGGFGGFGVPTRTQVVYSSSLFSDFGQGGKISEIRFRVDGAFQGFSTTVEYEIHFSTTAATETSLSTLFAANVGGDDTVALPRTRMTLTGSGPNSFGVVIPLPNQFNYVPAGGNLLMEFYAYEPGFAISAFDGRLTPGDGMSGVSGGIGSSFGSKESFGFVTQFVYTPIPEPRTVPLLLLGALALFLFYWRRSNVAA